MKLKIYDSFFKFLLIIYRKNSKKYIEIKYFFLKNRKSDIYEHMETLCLYAKKCESVFETGVRGVVSSWAFAKGLLDNRSNLKKILLNDIEECNTSEFEYHVNMARWMGFGKSFQDGCKVNVHISGRQGPEGIIKAIPI